MPIADRSDTPSRRALLRPRRLAAQNAKLNQKPREIVITAFVGNQAVFQPEDPDALDLELAARSLQPHELAGVGGLDDECLSARVSVHEQLLRRVLPVRKRRE